MEKTNFGHSSAVHMIILIPTHKNHLAKQYIECWFLGESICPPSCSVQKFGGVKTFSFTK